MLPSSDSRACDFLVNKQALEDCEFQSAPGADEIELADGQVLLAIDHFGFTANNITYAVMGESMAYWDFFPAPEGWGRVPVWGFADVVRSEDEAIEVGERIYGYLPMSTHLVVKPTKIGQASFVDATPHRQALPSAYNQYMRTGGDPGYDSAQEDLIMLLRPLFITSWLIDDFLADHDFFGAQTAILSSASSKTALGVAFLLAENRDIKVIGLTSAGNVEFVESTGCYDQVVSYDELESLPPDSPVVYVDMSGDGEVRSRLHHHYQDNVKHSCLVGATHWQELKPGMDLPGAKPSFFFAPTQVDKRLKDWGSDGFQQRLAAAWRQFLAPVSDWVTVQHRSGGDAIRQVYLDTLKGKVNPNQACVLTLGDG